MYGVWTNDADLNRRKTRLELIEFLLENNARDKAQAELVALSGVLPPNLATGGRPSLRQPGSPRARGKPCRLSQPGRRQLQ